jgi:DNA-binding NarL/FixJ family response regulator
MGLMPVGRGFDGRSCSSIFSAAMKILHLEDDVLDSELTKAACQRRWPACAIRRVTTRAEFNEALKETDYDVIISDSCVLSFSGIEAMDCARAAAPQVPFIFYSGAIGQFQRKRLLEKKPYAILLKDETGAALIATLEKLIDGRKT